VASAAAEILAVVVLAALAAAGSAAAAQAEAGRFIQVFKRGILEWRPEETRGL
jgi:hypothetical protein